MNTEYIKGVIVPIITPIDEDERINEAELRRQVDYIIDGGLQGILAFGSNGEFYQVEEDEMERGLAIMVDQAAGRVPVYFGIGAINTRKCIRLAKMAVSHGVGGVSILQPMFLKPSQDKVPFPNAAKDMAILRGRNVGVPYRPSLPTEEGPTLDYMKKVMTEAGLL